MQQSINLVLSLPHGIITATSLGVAGFAWHRSPGSGRHFRGRTVFVDLAIDEQGPAFEFLDEGGWRDAKGDTVAALAAARLRNRTKTALSNAAFNATPIAAYRDIYVAKTEGQVLKLEGRTEVARFAQNVCPEHATPDRVAQLAGLGRPNERTPRLYLVLCPVEFLVLSNLTPAEYAWYATHRPGKMFRQLVFGELRAEHGHVAAQTVYDEAVGELANTSKKTKTVVGGDLLNHVPFQAWLGYGNGEAEEGGLYVGDRDQLHIWKFPRTIPHAWERAV